MQCRISSPVPPFQNPSTDQAINATLKWKFLMINVVFYICWLPNLICGITLWTSWHTLSQQFILALWYTMAILNPLQAFFNTLVYRRWQPLVRNAFLTQSHLASQRTIRRSTDRAYHASPTTERSPLLQQPHEGLIRKPTAPPFHQL